MKYNKLFYLIQFRSIYFITCRLWLLLLFIPFIHIIFSLYEEDIHKLRSSNTRILINSNEINNLSYSIAYSLVSPEKFWSYNIQQISTVSPGSKRNLLIINCPSLNLNQVMFISISDSIGNNEYYHYSSYFSKMSIKQESWSGKSAWILRISSDILAYTINNEQINKSINLRINKIIPNTNENWYNTYNEHIKDMSIIPLWIS
ncbi:uncharacterized protein CMU_005270 [Cryptosporidium muris RN66]|uniref:Uncharacterized protein n=1 Tax=Cryptosporidium muris (strain RN66) TaxID=441375 RepID=B6AHA9_CRYMR|nr:uncharacterized protein CMU_005270 [Cryptosporidium muris RN66]EEA07604.1 hypothetical protein, conserved [Cryptosporidium muris RN66]|eukprot:XP_002141953.1 hypothetical protein [Cryptosporidium muris RN66]